MRTGRIEQICVLAAHLSDLLYLGPSLPDERATLAGRDDQPQGDWWLRADGAIGHQCRQILQGKRWKSGECWGGQKEERESWEKRSSSKVETEALKSQVTVWPPTIKAEKASNLIAAHLLVTLA